MSGNLGELVRQSGVQESLFGKARPLSQDRLILPYEELPKEVLEILQRAEKAGICVFEPYHFSGITLTQDTRVDGWNEKPGDWFWKQIEMGRIRQDPSRLPRAWVLSDNTPRPGYNRGKQLHENDPLGTVLAKLREDGKIKTFERIPKTSRFGISYNELTQVVLPEIARILGIESVQVRLPRAIECNVIGNLKHPEWGEHGANTAEWLQDSFEYSGRYYRLIGGNPVSSDLTSVIYDSPDKRFGSVAFRPLVVISPKA